MTHFWRHLRLLLWKNTILKLRQPVFLALEILWPVFLFGAILVPLRLQFPSQDVTDSRYRANALPSAGLFPFMQSVVCDLSKGPSEYSSDMPYYPNASVNDIYNLLDGVSSWNGSWNRVCSVLRETAAVRPCTNTSEALLRLLNTSASLDLVALEQLLSCGLLDQIRELNDVLALTETVSLYFRFANSTSSFSYEGLEKFLCGDLPVDDSALKSILRRLIQGDRTQRAFKKQQSVNDEIENGNGTGTDDGTQRIAPKILYTASSENMQMALSIMKRANRTIQSVEFFKSLAEQTHNCSEFFLETFPPNSPQVKILNEVIDVLLNSSNGVIPSLSSLFPSNESLLLAKQLLDPNSPNSIWEHVALVSNISLSVLDQIAGVDWEIFTPVTSEAEMQELSSNYLLQQQRGISVVFAGVVLEDFVMTHEGELQSLKIRIRMNSTYVHDTTLLRETVWVPGPEDEGWKRRYLDAGFVLLQDMVERGAMEEILGHTLFSPASYLNQMPYPCYEDDLFAQAMIVMLPISMTLAWLFSVAMTVRAIVLEKELRLREVMLMMGLSDGVLRLSWFITSLVVFTISVTIISAVLKLSGIMPYTNGFILWLFLMVYAVAMISYCFFISTFFTSANLGACISALVYFVLFFGQITVVTKQMYLNTAAIVLLSLVAPIGFGIGSNYMIDYEMQQVGLQWSNILVPPLQETHFNFLGIIGVLLLDSLLYLVVAWYLEAVFPGKYGVAKPFYFIFQPSYWLGVHHSTRVHNFELLPVDGGEDSLEDPSSTDTAGLPLGISVQHLTKVYTTGCFKWRKRIEAVKDLSLDFYEGQITALLGHNGAGKTTTMSLLTGLFGPTSGTARIYGNDIRHKMDHIRHSLGVCPQHNVLFDNLTVHEHMLFYGQLKGMSRKETLQQIPIWLEKVNLLSHSKKRSKHLSGGMQRKLSIMLAFLGDSRTVILDEPTSGVDPHARRQIWDFVGGHREGHTIILSTHHMDEAEILGDRIAVIANGSLRCYGSFEELRKRFGQGHRLTLVSCPVQCALNRTSDDNSQSNLTTSVSAGQSTTPVLHTSDMPTDRITNFIKEFIPSASLAEVRGLELHYLLPLNQSPPKVLAVLFDHLTAQQTSLAVSSFGFTACSLDEIFLQLAGDATGDQNYSTVREPHPSDEPHPSNDPMASNEPHPSDEPMDSNEPHSSDEPMDSNEPHPSDEPMTSNEPHHSDEPMDSNEPHPSNNPMDSNEPHPSDEPMASNEPHLSEPMASNESHPSEPMDSNQPHPSDEPMDSYEPHPFEPMASNEPHPSDEPMTSNEPHPSEPMASNEPHPSDEPMASNEPHPSEPMASNEPHPSDEPMASNEPHPSEPMASNEPHPSEPMASNEPHPSDEPMASNEPHLSGAMLVEGCEDGPGDEDGTEEERLWTQGETPFTNGYLTGPALWWAQYTSLLFKRFHYFRHKYVAIGVQTVFPLGIIALSMMIARTLLNVTDQPSLELSPAVFFGASRDNYAFMGGLLTNTTAPYLNTAYLPCGMDTSVMMSSYDQDSLCTRHAQEDGCDRYPALQHTCMCLNCSDRISMTTPPACYNGTHMGTRLLNVTMVGGDSEHAYDFLTSYLQWTENDFIEIRYGGLSFGHSRDDIPLSLDHYYSRLSNTSLPFFAAHTAAKAWYSLKGYHAMPSYLNSLNNVILRSHLPPYKDPTIYGIKTYNHPFPFTNLQRLDYAVTELGSAVVNPLAAMFAIGFLAAGFVLLIIEEKSNKVKHLQLVCGLNRGIYWLSSATWDLCSYILFMMAAVLIYVAFQDPNLTTSVGLPSFFIILVSYGAAIVPWMYSLSFLFSSPSTAYIVLFCLNFFSGFALLIVDVVIAFLTEAAETSYLLVYLPFPSYCLGRGMLYLTLDRVFQEIVATFTFKPVPSPFVGMWPFIVSLWVQAIVYTVCLVILESSLVWMCPLRRSQSVPKALPLSTSDDLVAMERERVLSNSSHEEILTLQNISKEYGLQCSKNRHLAVNQLCLGMQKGECFGLLGVNGAGKTTTFKMLTGDTKPSYGDALVASHSIKTGMGQVRQKIGYCPQVDALLDPLTGRQHLIHVCHLRGVPTKQLKEAVSWALKKLGLEIIADKPAGTYSGGNRRRLSTAIALLGRPPLLLLDEPTSGVDPKARRFLWDIIRGVVAEGQSVLVTTHSMAECEALCGRVGIMVNGSFKCLGTPQQLKTRYGEGYRVKVRVNGQVHPVKEFLKQNLKNSVLKEQHSNILIYQLSLEGLKLSDVFNMMEIARDKLDIEDYSVTQTTLDDVFVFFASQQHDGDTLREGQLEARLPDHETGTDGVHCSAETGNVHYYAETETVCVQ